MRQPNRAFTLIELRVVISIIALLIALLLPAIKRSKDAGRLAGCLSNQRQIGIAVHSYANDSDGFFPVPPLGEFMWDMGIDVASAYMSYLIGGDDTGVWDVTTAVPAERRPLADYIEPTSHTWRCPADTSPLEWFYGYPLWEAGTSSYLYNAGGLFGATLGEISQPSLMVMLGDWAWVCTSATLVDDDFVMLTTHERPWWHPGGFERRMVVLAFVDGHADYTPIQFKVPNTGQYRRDK